MAACIRSWRTSLKTLATKTYPKTDCTQRTGRCLAKVKVVVV